MHASYVYCCQINQVSNQAHGAHALCMRYHSAALNDKDERVEAHDCAEEQAGSLRQQQGSNGATQQYSQEKTHMLAGETTWLGVPLCRRRTRRVRSYAGQAG